ncbi:ISL3 family transposase [Streptomyces sp. Root1310]|uniref:ISL3 family transposase n=1 Tax=Streptomyces sp. Root1310 TaxID=1736452 RepID=UPI00070BDC63|nr:ISL3 family transposase [Streptomyces sp. Root1310]KQX67364.1 transposase [Streptomyces sp. Root1310]
MSESPASSPWPTGHRFAGLSQPWSSGVVDGHVNRIKMPKRQMFGRAGFELLRERVLLHS